MDTPERPALGLGGLAFVCGLPAKVDDSPAVALHQGMGGVPVDAHGDFPLALGALEHGAAQAWVAVLLPEAQRQPSHASDVVGLCEVDHLRHAVLELVR